MKRHNAIFTAATLLAALFLSPLASASDAMAAGDMPADSMGMPMKSTDKPMNDGTMTKEGQMKQQGNMDAKDNMKSGDSMAKPAKKMKKKVMKKSHGESARDKM